MNIVGRSYMLNTSGSYRVKKGLKSDRNEAIYLISIITIHLFLLQFLKHYFHQVTSNQL